MFQPVTRLKLLAKSLLITNVAGEFRFKPFQEMQLAIKLQAVGVAGSS